MNKKTLYLILKTILKLTIFILTLCFFFKLFNLNIFTIDLNNKIINSFYQFIITYRLIDFVKLFFIFIYAFLFLKICAENNNSDIFFISASLVTVLSYTGKYLLFDNIIFYLIYLNIILLIFNSIISNKVNIVKPLCLIFKVFFYLLIIMFIRSLKFSDFLNFKVILILSIDLILLLIVYYFFSNSIVKTSRFNFKILKKIKFSVFRINCPYLILISKFLITFASIIFIAYLNNTMIECLIILTSFFIAYLSFCNHLNFQLTFKFYLYTNFIFYVLNRMTFKVGLSFVIPISLGVILAYLAYLPIIRNMKINLYRGMNENKLRLVCINYQLNSFETNLLIDFYCYKLTLQDLAFKYSYSKDAIWKKKKMAIKKITDNQ
ncbi:MAG: hypothetical protein PHX04_04475 [Bacilli bacterium]|nr:hypothetical protein [Bacilli bacterium]